MLGAGRSVRVGSFSCCDSGPVRGVGSVRGAVRHVLAWLVRPWSGELLAQRSALDQTTSDAVTGRWLLNPGAVGAPAPSRLSWWDALDVQAADGAFWLLLDLKGRTATWRRAPYEPAPARSRARALGLDDSYQPAPSDARPKPSSSPSGSR